MWAEAGLGWPSCTEGGQWTFNGHLLCFMSDLTYQSGQSESKIIVARTTCHRGTFVSGVTSRDLAYRCLSSGAPSNPTSSFEALPFSCAIVFIVSGTPPLFCSSTAYFRLTAMTTPRRTGTRGRGGQPAGCRFTTLWLRLFLLGHGRAGGLTAAPIRLHDIGLAPLNRVGGAKQQFILKR